MKYLESSWASLEHPIKCCSPMAKEGIVPAAVLDLDISVEELRRIVDPTNSGWGDFDDNQEIAEDRVSDLTGSTWPGKGEDEGNLDQPYPEPSSGDDDEEGESEG